MNLKKKLISNFSVHCSVFTAHY